MDAENDPSANDLSGRTRKPSRPKAAPRPPRKITETYLHNAGLHYLQRFAASSGHFRRVMMRKVDKSCRVHTDQDRDECARMVDTLIDKFRRAGLLDDEAYAAGLAASLRRRGASGRAMEARLRARGVEPDRIAAIRARERETDADQDFYALLRLMRRKRLGPFRGEREADARKELAALARAGFAYDDAQRGLALPPDEAERLLLEVTGL